MIGGVLRQPFLLRQQLILFTNFITAKNSTKIYNYISDKYYIINVGPVAQSV